MQIRYQNVQKNITYMSVSFAFVKKCWKVHIRVLALLIPPWIVNSKKFKKNQKNMVAKNDKCCKCLSSFITERHWWKWWQKNNLFWSADCFFFAAAPTNVIPWWNLAGTKNNCHSLPPNLFLNFLNFLDFTIDGGSIRAKTRMGTFQHFFHECKWHWHICDVFWTFWYLICIFLI